jgi:hypothetical protein
VALLVEELEGVGPGALEELVWVWELGLAWALRWDKEFWLEKVWKWVVEFGLELAVEV